VWDPDTGKELRNLTRAGFVAFGADDRTLVTRTPSPAFPELNEKLRLDFSDLHSGTVLTTKSIEKNLQPTDWRTQRGMFVRDTRAYPQVMPLAFWSATREALSFLPGEASSAIDLAIAANEKRAVFLQQPPTLGTTSTVVVFDLERGKRMHRWEMDSGLPKTAVFSPDATTVAVWCDRPQGHETTIEIWDAVEGKRLRQFDVGVAAIWQTGIAFSPDGKFLATAGFDGGTVRLWDVGGGKLLLELFSKLERFRTVTFSPDGARLASGSESTIIIWNIQHLYHR
jgi:WD40 repeat protein